MKHYEKPTTDVIEIEAVLMSEQSTDTEHIEEGEGEGKEAREYRGFWD